MRQTQNTQKNSNKKSVFVIALLLLLVAVIGFGGYTMSKYISSKSDNGTASVAKWGFEVTAKGDKLFGKEYRYDTAKNASVIKDDTGATLTVQAATPNTNLVAPGTTGSMTFSITGTAEVRSQISVSLTGNDVVLKYKTSANEETPLEYAPVKWTLKKKGETTALVDNKSFEDLKKGLADLSATVVEANAAYANAGEYTIEWAWAFDGTASNANADKLDTLLGMVATKAGATHDALTNEGFTEVVADTKTAISFNLSISVTQLKGNE